MPTASIGVVTSAPSLPGCTSRLRCCNSRERGSSWSALQLDAYLPGVGVRSDTRINTRSLITNRVISFSHNHPRPIQRSFYFFFQAADGIRFPLVTGVQTCALPISHGADLRDRIDQRRRDPRGLGGVDV